MSDPTFEPPADVIPPPTEVDSLLQAGLAASQANDSEAAILYFEQAAAAQPGNGLPHFLLGSECAALGEVDKAEAAFANAVLLAPSLLLARYQLGLLQFSTGRAAVALVTWSPLLALDDSEALPHFVRGFAALAQGGVEGARTHFERGLDRNSFNSALSDDIRKVIARMETDVQAPARSEPEVAATNNHVLIANYGKAGTLH